MLNGESLRSSCPCSSRSTRSHSAGEAWVVRRDDRRQAVLGVHLAQQLVQRVGGAFVEIAGRFVREQQRRLHHQRARHGDPLLFAARQHARPVRQPLAETHPIEQ